MRIGVNNYVMVLNNYPVLDSNNSIIMDNMAAEAEGDDVKSRQRPVEFRGLCTHYVEGEDIRVSFRYLHSSFQPDMSDKIKLYARGARTGDRSIASARVGDVSKHRLCDGGLYKTGSVTITTNTVKQLATSQRSYVLLYGSGRLRQVVGKSDPFIICPQNEFPSIQIRSVEDSVYIEKLRAHSPIDNHPAYPKGVGLAANEEKEMSFVMVSDRNSPLEDWESLDEEEDSLSDSESWSEVGESLRHLSPSESHSLTSSDSESSEESDNEANTHNISGAFKAVPHSQVPYIPLNGSCSPPATSTPPPVPKPRRLNGEVKKTQTEQLAIKSEGCCHTTKCSNSVQEIPSVDQHFQNSSKHDLESSLPKSSVLKLDEPMAKVAELTDSMVIIDEITPEKVTMLKNSNKELRMKVRVLHDKLHTVAEERDSLLVTIEETQNQVSELKHDKSELQRNNKKLLGERTTLKSKCKRLENENAILTQHCEKQVVQMTQYETQLTAVSAEKERLQRQLHRITKKSKRHEESSELHHKRHRNRQKTTAANGRVQPSDSTETAAASQYGVRLQRPVIDVYVRDPPNKREVEKGVVNGESEATRGKRVYTRHVSGSNGEAKVQRADKTVLCNKPRGIYTTVLDVLEA